MWNPLIVLTSQILPDVEVQNLDDIVSKYSANIWYNILYGFTLAEYILGWRQGYI